VTTCIQIERISPAQSYLDARSLPLVYCVSNDNDSCVSVGREALSGDTDDSQWRYGQWRRFVIKYGGQGHSGQAIKLLQVPRKISFTFPFWHTSFIFDDVKFAELSKKQFYEEIMWHFRGSKHTLIPPTYFQGVTTHDPQDLRSWMRMWCRGGSRGQGAASPSEISGPPVTPQSSR